MNKEEKLIIEFEPETLADIFAAVHLCKVEISGLAKVERSGRKFRVYGNAFIFRQSCSPAGTEPDTESLNLFFNEVAASGDEVRIREVESQRLWWHSHVWFGVVFSGTDFRTMKNLLSGFDEWWLVFVANKHNQSCLALIEKNGGFLKYEEAPIRLNPQMSTDEFTKLIKSRSGVIKKLIDERVIISWK